MQKVVGSNPIIRSIAIPRHTGGIAPPRTLADSHRRGRESASSQRRSCRRSGASSWTPVALPNRRPDAAARGQLGVKRILIIARGEPRLGGSLVQKPECEIDREPELKKADGLLIGDLHLGRQDESRAGRRGRVGIY